VEDKKIEYNVRKQKDPKNHCNHCNIDGHIEEKCWKLHPTLNLKKHKEYAKKNNVLATGLRNHVEFSYDVDGNIFYTLV